MVILLWITLSSDWRLIGIVSFIILIYSLKRISFEVFKVFFFSESSNKPLILVFPKPNELDLYASLKDVEALPTFYSTCRLCSLFAWTCKIFCPFSVDLRSDWFIKLSVKKLWALMLGLLKMSQPKCTAPRTERSCASIDRYVSWQSLELFKTTFWCLSDIKHLFSMFS